MATFLEGQSVMVYAESEEKWYNDGIIKSISESTGNIKVLCNDEKSEFTVNKSSGNIVAIKEENIDLRQGSFCSIFSITKWCPGIIITSENDKENEWLQVEYFDEDNNLSQTQIQRHSHFLKPLSHHQCKSFISLLSDTSLKNHNPYHPWIRLDDLPTKSKQGDLVKLNNQQFIILNGDEQYLIIHIFDTNTIKWELFTTYSPYTEDIDADYYYPYGYIRAAYNPSTDTLHTLYRSQLTSDKNTYSLSNIDNLSHPDQHKHDYQGDCSIDQRMIRESEVIPHKNSVHLMNGQEDKYMIVEKYKKLKTSTHRMPLPFGSAYKPLLSMYIPSKQLYLVPPSLYHRDGLRVYHLKTKQWSRSEEVQYRNTSDRGWDYFQYAVALSPDERIAVFANRYYEGMIMHSSYDEIVIMEIDIDDDGDKICCRVRDCKIALPKHNRKKRSGIGRRIVITEDNDISDIEVIGYLRELKMYIPMDIVGLILGYYEKRQWLHSVYFGEKDNAHEHYIIPLDVIVNNCKGLEGN